MILDDFGERFRRPRVTFGGAVDPTTGNFEAQGHLFEGSGSKEVAAQVLNVFLVPTRYSIFVPIWAPFRYLRHPFGCPQTHRCAQLLQSCNREGFVMPRGGLSQVCSRGGRSQTWFSRPLGEESRRGQKQQSSLTRLLSPRGVGRRICLRTFPDFVDC